MKSLLDSIVIEVEAKRWNDPDDEDFDPKDFDPNDPYQDEWVGRVIHEEFTGLPANVAFLRFYLSTGASIKYGHLFDCERHSPRDLFEALCCREYQILKIEGHDPKNDPPDVFPPGAEP